MYSQREFYFVRHLSVTSLMGVWSLLRQSKFEGLIPFRDVNQERVDTELVTVAQ